MAPLLLNLVAATVTGSKRHDKQRRCAKIAEDNGQLATAC
jgi:hypothetical protein